MCVCAHTPARQAAVVLRALRYVRRQNAHFTEEIFFFSEEDPYKAALFLFSQKKKSKNLKTDDVRQDKHRQHTRRLSGQKRSELCDVHGVFRPLLPVVLEERPQRLRSKKPAAAPLAWTTKCCTAPRADPQLTDQTPGRLGFFYTGVLTECVRCSLSVRSGGFSGSVSLR